MRLFRRKQKNPTAKQSAKAVKLLRDMKQKTAGLYEHSSTHWFWAKLVVLVCVFGVAIVSYLFHQQISQEAFDSASEVEAVGVEDIATDDLLQVLREERRRTDRFAELLEQPPVSFDPAFYGVQLQRTGERDDTSTTTQDSGT